MSASIGISQAYAAYLPPNKRCSARPAKPHSTAAKQSPAAPNDPLTITAFRRIRSTRPRPKSYDNPGSTRSPAAVTACVITDAGSIIARNIPAAPNPRIAAATNICTDPATEYKIELPTSHLPYDQFSRSAKSHAIGSAATRDLRSAPISSKTTHDPASLAAPINTNTENGLT